MTRKVKTVADKIIKGVIFDMDGVLVDSERESSEGWRWAAKEKNVDMPEWLIDKFKGAPATLSAQWFEEYFKGQVDYWEMRDMRTRYVLGLREKNGITVKPGVFTILDYIRDNGLRCAVATSTQKQSAEKTLHAIGAWEYLDFVVYGDQVENGKPAPDIFLKAAEMLGMKPEESIVVEDSINGIKAGYNAGMRVVHVPDTIMIDDDIRKLTYRVCDSLAEMPAVIDEINGVK